MPRPEQTAHSFFFIRLIGKIEKRLVWMVLVGVCTQKDSLHASTCTDSISSVYSDFNCPGLCVGSIISNVQQKYDGGCEDAQESLLNAAMQQSPGD